MKVLLCLIAASISMIACAPTSNENHSLAGILYPKRDIAQLQTCSLTNDCPSGQSCNAYDASGKTYCYAEGHEDEVVGCTSGQLIMFDSNPGQLACD